MGSRGCGPLAFFDTVQIVPLKFLNQFRRNASKNKFKKRKNRSKGCANGHSLEVFHRYFKKDTKAWFSPVRLIYSHSLIHNIISNRTSERSFFIALKIFSKISVCLSVRIKRKRFVFNRMKLFYFKGNLASPLRHGGKTIYKHGSLKKLIYKYIFA